MFYRRGEDLIYRLLWPRDLSFRDGARISGYRSRKTTIPRGQTHWEYIYTYTYTIYMVVCAVAAADGPPLRFTTFCPPDKSRPFVTPWRVSGASPTGNQGGGCICLRFYFFSSFSSSPTTSSLSFPSSVGSLLFLPPHACVENNTRIGTLYAYIYYRLAFLYIYTI